MLHFRGKQKKTGFSLLHYSTHLKNAISFPCFRRTGLAGASDDEELEEETDNLCNLLMDGTIGKPKGTLSPISCIHKNNKLWAN